MVFVRYMRSMCIYICIYIYIFFEEHVCKIYGSMRDMEIKCSKYMSLCCCWSFFFVCYFMGYAAFKQARFCKRIGERDRDVFMSSKMMKFLNKRVRE